MVLLCEHHRNNAAHIAVIASQAAGKNTEAILKRGVMKVRYLLFLILACCPTVVFGQVSLTGQIRGVVTDPTGAVLPNASLTVTSSALMAERKATTGADGSYLFDSLPPGTYQLTVTADGYKTSVQSKIVLTAGFTATISPTLVLGATAQTVQVTEQGPVVDTVDNESATTFDEQLLQGVPSGRDIFSTVAEAPGVASSDFDIGGSQSFQQNTMEVHGSLPGDQVYSFNGLRLNWPGATGGYTSFYVDDDAFSELQVITDSAPAEVAVGGVYMNLVPKSGSNSVHGLAAIYYDTAATEATINNPTYNGSSISAGTPIIMTRDTTVNMGAPLLRDKWWIFGAWRLYLVKESVLSVRNQAGFPITDPNHQSNTTLRSDYKLSKNNKLDFVWWFNEQNRFFRRDTAYAFVSSEAAWRQIEPAYILQTDWVSTVRNFVFDTRFGFMHQIFPLGPEPGTNATDINRQDVTLSTETGAAPYYFVNPAHVLAFTETVSLYKNDLFGAPHNFKFGVDSSTNYNEYDYNVNQGINAVFNNGVPIQVVAYNTPDVQKNIYHETAAYAQDSVTLKRKLTLNLGIRYDHFVTFNPTQVSPPAFFPTLFTTRTFPQSKNYVNWNTFRPRIGVAYDVTGKGTSVIRGYFGQFDVIQGTGLAETVNPNGLSTQVYTWNDTNHDNYPQTSEWLSPANLIAASGGVVTSIDPNLNRPYTNELNVGYEKQVLKDVLVGVNYYFRNIKDQYAVRNLDNLPTDYVPTQFDDKGNPLINPITKQPITLYNLNPSKVGLANYLLQTIPELNTNHYNGLEFTVQKRMSSGWQVLAGYTLQQQKGTYYRGSSDDFNNPNNEINRANSILNYDATNIFKVNSNYTFPKRIETGVTFQHYTGYPVDPIFGPPQAVYENLNQGQVTVIALTQGKLRLPGINILNVRISRPSTIKGRVQLEPIVDLFNITNANTVTDQVSTFGSSYLQPTNQLNPFIARFAMRLTF